MEDFVKQELAEPLRAQETSNNHEVSNVFPAFIELSSDSESDSEDSEQEVVDGILGGVTRSIGLPNGVDGGFLKKRRLNELGVILPLGFLPPAALAGTDVVAVPLPPSEEAGTGQVARTSNANAFACKQFWKAGDFEEAPCSNWESSSSGMDHVRVHPKFLHSNATSHKWALGAFAELLDNSLDEVCNGATHVNIDVLVNKKDTTRMLLIEDNGGGMSPDKMRHCMSLGYSEKSKLANTIGQYGNGFKTSTMRLGADVIVFSRCGKNGKSGTQSIGLLSYTFLRSTGKEDIIVPMLDYERKGGEWTKIVRSSLSDWNKNVETIVQWSPFASETELLRQFYLMKDHGTRIIIYNLWEDDQGQLELDFDTDQHDIQIRGVNRDEKNIQMAKKFPNSRHFLTYRHSLRGYASILYLRLPPGFRIILRGRDVEHHNIVNDMMMSQEVTYRPQPVAEGVVKDTNMVAVVTIGFVKDAKHHIDVQGFNVYHKNRLIKPFWRLWNASGSDGRGVIGVLEANFVEPAHDKQGFERTTVLARLEARLIQMQKTYWASYCHKIGYAPRRINKFTNQSPDRESSPDDYSLQSSPQSRKKSGKTPDKVYSGKDSEKFQKTKNCRYVNGDSSKDNNSSMAPEQSRTRPSSKPPSPSPREVWVDSLHGGQANSIGNGTFHEKEPHGNDVSATMEASSNGGVSQAQEVGSGSRGPQLKGGDVNTNERSLSSSEFHMLQKVKEENAELKERLQRKEADLNELQHARDRCKSLEAQLKAAELKIEELNKEQESLIDIFSEERDRRETEERNLRKKLQEASNTIQELLDKIRILEKR
ncbi:protein MICRORCHIDIA 7-like isoform X1 [Cucurbita maxima]|uniref:Protein MICRORCHIDIA 7-like isoform X1 n=1 Tax=Cucurbita maxima TaxID=3661 RepID=A0A6J1L0Q9_CUCMA|nr:protein MICRORCHIDIA 7-like isoform X1 [Cucurbita maxima]